MLRRREPLSCGPVIQFPLMDERPATKTVLARNLRHLMEDRRWDQLTLAKKSGVSQKTISNILRQEKVPTLDTVESIAQAFGLNLWHLIMPTLVDDLQSQTSIRSVYNAFIKSSERGKAFILTVAEREADLKDAS